MLSLASYLDEHSAKLKHKALGRVQVGVARAPPNHFHPFLVQNFGYSFSDVASEASDVAQGAEVREVEEQYSHAQSAASQAAQPIAAKPIPSGGGDVINKPEYISPSLTKATVFKPGVEEKFW